MKYPTLPEGRMEYGSRGQCQLEISFWRRAFNLSRVFPSQRSSTRPPVDGRGVVDLMGLELPRDFLLPGVGRGRPELMVSMLTELRVLELGALVMMHASVM